MTYARAEALIQSEIFTDTIDRVDLLVGIVSNKRTSDVQIPLVKAYEGLKQTYPELVSAIAFCDSSHKTVLRESFLSAPCPIPRIYQATEMGHERKINSLFNLMHLAKRLQAKVVVALDGDLTSVKRTWIGRLADPILSGTADYTAPFYHSLKYDTPVTNIFGYPLFRALFGRRLRQPFFADRAFSRELNDYFLTNQKWPLDMPYAATEMTLAVLTINKKGRICQSFMATPRLSWQTSDLDIDTGVVFQEVAASLFTVAECFQDVWVSSKRSRPTNITGTDLNPSVISPRKITPLDNFLAVINKTVSQYGEVWHEAFNGEQDLFFKKLGCQSANSIKISAETWAQICFQSIIAFHKLDKNLRADFLKALTAVFYGRLITWLHSGFSLSLPQMESLTEEECAIFESKRSVILERWPELHNQSN